MVEMEIFIKVLKNLAKQRQLMEKEQREDNHDPQYGFSELELGHRACPEETAKHPSRNPPSLLHDRCQILGCCCPCGCL